MKILLNSLQLIFLHVLLISVVVIGNPNILGKSIGNNGDECRLPLSLRQEISSYKTVVNKIIKSATSGKHQGKTWNELSSFVDKFGSRIAGSKNLENAIDYMLNRSKAYGLENVHGEPVTVPHWVRGHEEATMLSPRVANLNILGLGLSIGTPPEGITAQVCVVETFEELTHKKNECKGKIVVFAEKWVSYGVTVAYRSRAAIEGAKVGAVAAMIRSVTPFSINSPHTGMMGYDESVPKIPAAALTVEDAAMLLRMYRRGDNITINLKMGAKSLSSVESRNTIAEIEGSSNSSKVVIVSGHLDSWDVGTGAMDDGGGAFISWYSLVLLKQLQLRPKRTIRAVLWTGEEEGLYGAFEYYKAHDKDTFNLLMESDEGTFAPEGIIFNGTKQASCIMQQVLNLLEPLNSTKLTLSSDVGSDIMVWSGHGVPLGAIANKNEKYFWYHHSNGDRMVVEDDGNLDKCLALWAAVAYVVADLSVDLPL